MAKKFGADAIKFTNFISQGKAKKMDENLFLDENPESQENFIDNINKNSLKILENCKLEASLKKLFQFAHHHNRGTLFFYTAYLTNLILIFLI